MGKNEGKNEDQEKEYRPIGEEELKRILEEHQRWIDSGRKEGKRADLSGADLSKADLNQAELSEANLSGADLTGANLTEANLAGANLSTANLSWALLIEADLIEANLCGANLSYAHLSGADLSRADLSKANLEMADLNWAQLSGANLNGARLIHVYMQNATLKGVDLREADLRWGWLERADLSDVDLRGANLTNSYLMKTKLPLKIENANLTGARGAVLDGHDISKVRFGPKPIDPYHVLKRHYSGPAMIYNLIFLGTFITPYGLRAAFFKLIHWAQEEGIIEQLNAGTGAIQITTGDEWMTWQLMLGLDKGWTYAATAIVLLFYNLARAYLTRWMVGVREDVDQSGIAPMWNDYKWQYRFHFWILQVVFFASVLSFGYHAYDWLTEPISVPIGWRAP